MPDPRLLLLKAATNYLAYHKTMLLPSCPLILDEDGPPNTLQGTEIENPQESFLLDALYRGGFCPTIVEGVVV